MLMPSISSPLSAPPVAVGAAAVLVADAAGSVAVGVASAVLELPASTLLEGVDATEKATVEVTKVVGVMVDVEDADEVAPAVTRLSEDATEKTGIEEVEASIAAAEVGDSARTGATELVVGTAELSPADEELAILRVEAGVDEASATTEETAAAVEDTATEVVELVVLVVLLPTLTQAKLIFVAVVAGRLLTTPSNLHVMLTYGQQTFPLPMLTISPAT